LGERESGGGGRRLPRRCRGVGRRASRAATVALPAGTQVPGTAATLAAGMAHRAPAPARGRGRRSEPVKIWRSFSVPLPWVLTGLTIALISAPGGKL
jgi:hypothetical protein